MSCFWGHEWGRWSEPVNQRIVQRYLITLKDIKDVRVTVSVQHRECVRCGQSQVRHDQLLAETA